MAARRVPGTTGLAAGLAVLALVVTLDVTFGQVLVISGAYGTGAIVASVTSTTRGTMLVGAAAVLLSILSGIWNDNFRTLDWGVKIVITVGVSALAVAVARVRVQREQALRHMTVIAETAQLALLRSVPTAIGSVGFGARYVSATQEAHVGGDLYEVADSPYGVRVIVGDVRGKGLEAVHLASTVLGAFRRGVFTEPKLTELATEMDTVVRSVADEEDFVTVLLAEFHDDHTMRIVSCGHHPPMLVTQEGRCSMLPIGEPVLPVGLAPTPAEVSLHWPEGGRILLYTDGLVETRDKAGAFFPLDRFAPALIRGSLDEALDQLLRQLGEHARNGIGDDVALILVEDKST